MIAIASTSNRAGTAQEPECVTGRLADFLAGLRLADLPGPVVEEAKTLLLDSVACIIAGSRGEIGPLVAAQAVLFGAGNDDASVAGVSGRVNLLAAAYGNGRLGNCLDFDETYPGGAVGGSHFGVAAVASALALCEQRRLSGKDLLLATIAGYELGGRVADAGTQLVIENGQLRGFPPVWGLALPFIYASVGAAAKALGLGPGATREAFGLAGANTPAPVGPLWSAMITLPNTKYCDSGWCTLTGLFAALSAQCGSTGPNPVFDGERSVFRMIGFAKVDPDGLIGDLGSRWALANITYKPWPSCRWHHQALTALMRLRDREGFDPNEIDLVVVETNTALLSPRFRNQNPPNFIARQFSFPHAVAMLLSRVPAGPEWLSDDYADRVDIAALRAKVVIEEHPRARACVEHFVRGQVRQMPSGVRIHARGTVFRLESDFALGDPWDAATRWGFDDVAAKFRAATGLAETTSDTVIEAIARLETLEDLEPITTTLRGSGSPR